MKFQCSKLTIKHHNIILLDISFTINHSLALIGQSGSGKSLTLKALLGLNADGLEVDMVLKNNYKLIRGKNIAYVPQNPFTALSPMGKIKDQFFCNTKEVKRLLTMVNLDHTLMERYPSQLSGGQLQRIVIAMALMYSPTLLLLDEPTTALDSKSKMIILDLLKNLQEKMNFLMLFVTHDIHSIVTFCENIAIIKEGKIIETGKTEAILYNPQEKYTKMLLKSGFKNREFRC
jgi:peptide/nickel transport system ATP-binding protein